MSPARTSWRYPSESSEFQRINERQIGNAVAGRCCFQKVEAISAVPIPQTLPLAYELGSNVEEFEAMLREPQSVWKREEATSFNMRPAASLSINFPSIKLAPPMPPPNT